MEAEVRAILTDAGAVARSRVMIVVDTNVVSELMRPQPDESVRQWVQAQSAPLLHSTAITVAEILHGIERLADGERKAQLRGAASDVFAAFTDQVLAFDGAAAASYALVVAGRDHAGRPINGYDAQIAAICRTTGATLATRNVRDFEHAGLDVVDPWHSV